MWGFASKYTVHIETPLEIALNYNILLSVITADNTLLLVTFTFNFILSNYEGKDLPKKSYIRTTC